MPARAVKAVDEGVRAVGQEVRGREGDGCRLGLGGRAGPRQVVLDDDFADVGRDGGLGSRHLVLHLGGAGAGLGPAPVAVGLHLRRAGGDELAAGGGQRGKIGLGLAGSGGNLLAIAQAQAVAAGQCQRKRQGREGDGTGGQAAAGYGDFYGLYVNCWGGAKTKKS